MDKSDKTSEEITGRKGQKNCIHTNIYDLHKPYVVLNIYRVENQPSIGDIQSGPTCPPSKKHK